MLGWFHQSGAEGQGQPSEYWRVDSLQAAPFGFACVGDSGMSSDAKSVVITEMSKMNRRDLERMNLLMRFIRDLGYCSDEALALLETLGASLR